MTDITAPTRRNLLGHVIGATAAMAIVTSGTQAPVDPDARLIAMCATLLKACADLQRFNGEQSATDEDMDAAAEAFWDPIPGVIAAQATTMAGITAKAEAMIAVFANGGVQKYASERMENAAGQHEMLAWRLAHDVVAMGRAA